jgi:hypothetical protein
MRPPARLHLLVAVVVVCLLGTSTRTLAGPDDHRQRDDRMQRALAIVEELHLDDATTAKLFPVLSEFEQDRDRLLGEYWSLHERAAYERDHVAADRMLDRLLATHRSLLATETTLVTRLRQLLPADQAARARVILTAPSPGGGWSTHAGSHDPDALFPPGSQLAKRAAPARAPVAQPTGSCDPFAQMHRCPSS